MTHNDLHLENNKINNDLNSVVTKINNYFVTKKKEDKQLFFCQIV